MLWCQGAQNIGLSDLNLNPRYHAPYDPNTRQSETEGQTDGRTSWQ